MGAVATKVNEEQIQPEQMEQIRVLLSEIKNMKRIIRLVEANDHMQITIKTNKLYCMRIALSQAENVCLGLMQDELNQTKNNNSQRRQSRDQ